MVYKIKSSFIKRFPICLFCFFIFLFFFIPIHFTRYDLLAQEEEVATTIIEKSTNLLINKEVIEILQVKDSDGDPLAGKIVTVTVDDPDVVTISILDFIEDDDLIINEGSELEVQTDSDGRKAFIINAASDGTAKITFEVTGEDGSSTPVIEELNVNVVDLEAIISVDKDTGEAPLTVQFTMDSSSDVEEVKWNFDDGSEISTEENPEHIFEDSGIFNVTLEVTQITNFGIVTDNAGVPIFVSPEVEVEEEQIPGTIFGTVFDLTTNVPINRAKVVLLTAGGSRQVRTDREGVYRFENVDPGDIVITVCKTLFYECIVEEVDYNGGSLLIRFDLIRKDFFMIPTTTLP